MKKHKKLIIGIIIGFLVGILFTGSIFMFNNSFKKEQSVNEIKEEKKEEKDKEKYIQDTYDKEIVYVGGDTVIYKGKEYKAKWWTQNEEPGNSEVWEYIRDVEVEKKEETEEISKDIAIDTKGFKVIAYYPSWKTQDTDKIDYSIITHINYAFAIPTAEGKLRPLENASTAKKIIADAHKHDTKVMLAVGGWSYNDVPLEATFMKATENEQKLKAFGDAIVDMCVQYGFDGIDMDWEHPRVDGTSKTQYETLMLYLKQELSKRNKLLSAAVLSGVNADGNVYYDANAHSDKVLKACDWINVMAYDGGDGERHSSYTFAKNSAFYWKNTRKMPANKVVLGVPFYARPSWASYDEILKQDKEGYKKDHTLYNGMDVYYNGMSTIEKKTRFAKKNVGGVMIWEITQDTREKDKRLLEAIKKGITE